MPTDFLSQREDSMRKPKSPNPELIGDVRVVCPVPVPSSIAPSYLGIENLISHLDDHLVDYY